MTKRIAVKDLHADSIDAVSITVEDWREVFSNFEERDGNQFWEASECDKCGAVVVFHCGGGGDQHKDYDNDSECDGYLQQSEGPMMNYWYQLGDAVDAEDAARKIADLPLCVVQVNGEYGLALTGGGMNLSWEICEAYTRLGELPPMRFCSLPSMCGRGTSARDQYIMAACRASARVQIARANDTLRALRDGAKWARNRKVAA